MSSGFCDSSFCPSGSTEPTVNFFSCLVRVCVRVCACVRACVCVCVAVCIVLVIGVEGLSVCLGLLSNKTLTAFQTICYDEVGLEVAAPDQI